MKRLSSLRRRAFIGVLLLGGALAGFLMGLRSATQKDFAYYGIKELKIAAVHQWVTLREKLSGGAPQGQALQSDEIKVFTANDFSLELLHLPAYGSTEKTAGFIDEGGALPVKIEQNDVDVHWARWQLGGVITDAKPSTFRGGGIKQVFRYQGQTLALVSMQALPEGCRFASLVNVTAQREVFRAPCLPPVDEIDFSAIGGGWVADEGGILMSLGTPSDDLRIAGLAQDPASPYGKVLFFPDAQLRGEGPARETFVVHSSGHRNPQGLVRVGGALYATDHGPKGGDEINLLQRGHNYGWPLYSLGSTYQGQPHEPVGDPARFDEPLFSFIPAVAPSDILACPSALAERYAPLQCVLITSLRGMSLFVGLIDDQHRVVSLERLSVDMRLREFVALPGERLGVSTDGYGVFEIKLADVARRPAS